MSDNYDRIARFYDVDMARNMAFDDVAFYRAQCMRVPGPVVELGCGNGRILLELLAAGIDAFGVDASVGMLTELTRKAAARRLPARAACMDIRTLGLRPGLGTVLCPYSLVTYVTSDDDTAALFTGVLALLRPGGRCVVDAFIPRPFTANADFVLDYRRPFGNTVLARWKRITAVSATVNRIERRYVVEDAQRNAIETIDVVEEIRPRAPAELAALLVAAGFATPQTWWDYGASVDASGAQFATLVAACPAPPLCALAGDTRGTFG